jgi:hypothetical protein
MAEMENEFTTPQEGDDELEAPEKGAPEADLDVTAEEAVAVDQAPADEAEVAEAELEQAPVPEEPKEESDARRFFRRALRWTLGLMIVFGLGFIAAIFSLYRPEVQGYRQRLKGLQNDLQAAEARIAELEERVEALAPLEAQNEVLLAAQGDYELHVAILEARVDVTNALLALAEEDMPLARVSLQRTGEALEAIESLLPIDQRDIVVAMEQRLDLVRTEIEEDSYAAQSDLDVLAKRLLELEDSLFGMQ